MDNKVVCYYCGTIYSEERGKCPLCGSSARSEEPEAVPVRRQRLTEQERREQRRAAAKGKYSAKTKKKSTKPAKGLLTAALIFLLLSVAVLTFFIGDMNGWWGGLEDRVDRTKQTELLLPDTSCTELRLSAETLELSAVGETAELTVAVNTSCTEVVYCNSSNAGVAVIDKQAQTENSAKEKTAVFTIAATGAGSAEIKVTCGKQTKTCTVTVGDAEPVGTTEPVSLPPLAEDFVPELSCGENVSLFAKGDKTLLRVSNLPEGYGVDWATADATVVKVSEAGELTAIGSGRTTVTATVGGKTAQVLVRCVFDGDDIGAHLENTDVTLRVGDTFYLYLYDSQGEHITDITYTVSNAGVCKAENGIVTALASGTSTVTVSYHNQQFECIVRVR